MDYSCASMLPARPVANSKLPLFISSGCIFVIYFGSAIRKHCSPYPRPLRHDYIHAPTELPSDASKEF